MNALLLLYCRSRTIYTLIDRINSIREKKWKLSRLEEKSVKVTPILLCERTRPEKNIRLL